MLINELNDLCLELPKAVEYIKKWGKKYAEAETNYYIAKQQATLKFKSEGIAATLIPLLVKGECSKELLEMEINKSMYDASKENVNAIKTRIRILELQISMEWGLAKKE